MRFHVIIILCVTQRDKNVMVLTIAWIGVIKWVVVSIILEKQIPVSAVI